MVESFRSFRRLRAAIVAASVSLPVGQLHAQGVAVSAPPVDTAAIARVTVDLAAAAFDRVLPFDVPFFVVGMAPVGAASLEVQYAEVPRSGLEPNPQWRPTVAPTWKPEPPVASGQTFVVFFREPLEADRYYHFRFSFLRQPSAEQTRQFRELARVRLDQALRPIAALQLPLPDAAPLRRELSAMVRAIAGSAEWRIAPGSFFDTSDESPAALVRFLDEARTVLAPQLDRQQILPGLTEVQLRLRPALESILTSSELRELADAAAAVNDPGLSAVLQVNADGLALSRLTADEAALASVGGIRGDQEDFWRATEVKTRAANFERTLRQLQQLRHFIQIIAAPQGAARPLLEPVVGDAVLRQAAALIEPTGSVTQAIEHAQRALIDVTRLAEGLAERDQGLARLADLVTLLLLDERFAEATTVAGGETAQNNYVSADAGFLYAGDIGTAALYIGTNIYFRPVNKDAPLSQVSSFGRRFAVTIGITVSSVADENNRTRTDLFANQSMVIGGGYRLTQSIRGGAGAIVFRESNPNPLITRKSAAATWYVSFSFDLDVARGFAGLGGQFR